MAVTSPGVSSTARTILQTVAGGFAFGEAVLFAVNPLLTKDDVLLNAANLAAGRVGTTGVGVATACLVFTSLLLSLGSSFLLAALLMKLCAKVGVRLPWFLEVITGASIVTGAVGTGVLAGLLPTWILMSALGILVLAVYLSTNINDMTVALLIIFTTLYFSVVFGRLGFIAGLFSMGITISVVCVLRKALTERSSKRPQSKTRCKLLERIFFYSVFVGILGFFVGLCAGVAGQDHEEEVILMLESVLWVVFLSAGLLGAGLGTVTMVGLGQEAAGKVGVAVAVVSTLALRVVLFCALGAKSSMGGTLGAATAAGVSLGAASVAAKQAFEDRNSTLTLLASVVCGVFLAIKTGLTSSVLTTPELIAVTLVSVGGFILGAPKSPFNTPVNLQRGLLTGPELIKVIGLETVTGAAAPIGAGALGVAALGTAALGKLGTVGVVVLIVMALGSTLSGMIGKEPETESEHED